jgi:hypothetical protein
MKFNVIILLACFTATICTGVVCSENELVDELLDDIDDNGFLDCLRESSPPPGEIETDEKRLKREKANWNGDCSFKSESERK